MASLLSAVRDIGRLREIYLVLVRHGFRDLAQRLGFAGRKEGESQASNGSDKHSLAERVRLVAIDLGPSFVKLGQLASTRPDILPEEWIVELKRLQDEVPPVAFEEIQNAVESSLGAPLDELFESFDEEPLAAASIAQVHRAVLKHEDGPKQVVVKVQRPNIADTISRDLDLLHTLARFVERTIPESHIYQPTALVGQFDNAITSELDFVLEADNAKRFSENFAGHAHAVFPGVFRDCSSKRVITMDFLDGHKVYDAIENHGHVGRTIAKAITGIVIKSIFEDGFFHADPHPGNILLFGEPAVPKVGFVDLGMVGRLSPEMRTKTIDMMIAAIRNDHIALADALYEIGTPTRKVDMRAYRAEVSRLADKYLNKPLGEIDLALLIADLVRGATKFGLEIPSDFLMVGKALMTMEGVGREIDPDLDVYSEARPYFLELLRKRYAPERIAVDMWRGAERLSKASYDLPHQVRDVMDDLRNGRLTVQSRNLDAARVTDRLGRRVFTGLVVSSLILAGSWLVSHDGSMRYIGGAVLALGITWLFAHVLLDLKRG